MWVEVKTDATLDPAAVCLDRCRKTRTELVVPKGEVRFDAVTFKYGRQGGRDVARGGT